MREKEDKLGKWASEKEDERRKEREWEEEDEGSGWKRKKKKTTIRRGVEWKRKSVWSVQEEENEEEEDGVRWADEGEERDLNNYRFEGVAACFARNQERAEAASVSDY